MGLEILVWIWVLTWMTKTAATDVIYSLQGQVPPRKRERLARAERGDAGPQRYGLGGWFADLQEDALRAHTEKRRAAAKAKGQPLDDLAEAVREKPAQVRTAPEREEDLGPIEPIPPTERCRRADCDGWIIEYRSDGDELCGRCGWASERRRRRATPTDPNGVASCQRCGGTAVVDGVPCADCLAVQQQRNDEWASRAQTLATDNREPTTTTVSAPLATVIPMFPNTKEIDMANIEATGLDTAIAFADAAANAHNSFATSGSEGYVGALERMEMGPEYIGAAREAMEASTTAAAKWADLSGKLATQKTGQEFYRGNSDAAGKAALIAE